MQTELATLAGGCFWCLEAVFERVPGILSVMPGYIGGSMPNPDYAAVCSGQTGHAEAVQLTFDPQRISFRRLLEIFFAIHDPTTPNRQGNDIGTQYRSAIFCHDAQQLAEARATIAELSAPGNWPAPVVTEVTPAPTFYPAEAYHRRYYARHPEQGYCRLVIAPKLAQLRTLVSG